MGYVIGFEDHVRETTATTGTGSVSLSGVAPADYATFASHFSNNQPLYYCIMHQTANQWEVGLGTYVSAGNSLTRNIVRDGSSGTSLVSLSAGTKDVFCTLPANCGSKEILTADRSFFIRSGGTDAPGFGFTSGAAFATVQYAYDTFVANHNAGSHTVTFDIGAGTFTGVNLSSAWDGGGTLLFQGAGSGSTTLQSTSLVPCIQNSVPVLGQINIAAMTLTDANGWSNINLGASASFGVTGGDVNMSSSTASHIQLSAPGTLFQDVDGNGWKINGGATQAAMQTLTTGCRIRLFGTITITGTISFSPFCDVQGPGQIKVTGGNITGGTVSGRRFSVDSNGQIDATGKGVSFFPGNSAGVMTNGGVYLS